MKKLAVASLALAAVIAHAQHPEVVAYPSQGQSAEQQAADRDACRTWARGESGYSAVSDRAMAPPRLPLGPAISPPPVTPNPNDATYLRALAACIEGRGYAIR